MEGKRPEQMWAIARSRENRRRELIPIRAELDALISQVGWRRARPVVEEILGCEVKKQRGWWWSRIGKRNAALITHRLRALGTQERLF